MKSNFFSSQNTTSEPINKPGNFVPSFILPAIVCLIFPFYLKEGQASDPKTYKVERNGMSFQVREGLEWELVAGANVVQWPIVATWDNDGNLIVAESAGVKQSVNEQLKTTPHRIVRLIDSDRDGVFETRQVIADKLQFPEGLLCYGDELLVSAPPQIWKFSDLDRDGVFEQRTVWHDGKTLTGCANDLHGPFLGPEGWIYWSKSAFAKQSFPVRNGLIPESSASHLYRKPFHSESADRVLTGGMDNLVHVSFDLDGDKFFVSTFLHHPGNGLRDGVGHGVYGSVFGKNHAVLDGHVRTGGLMKPLVELGPAAPSGIELLDGAQSWIPGLATMPHHATFAVAQFNLQRVSSHVLTVKGATFHSMDQNLVVGDQLDFHPVGVLQDIDNSLIVVDTGGWYDLCCPSSGKEERIAKGGIYRLRPRTVSGHLKPQWDNVSKLLDTEPTAALSHQNKRVREHAERQLLRPGNVPDAGLLSDLRRIMFDSSKELEIRQSAFWTLAKSLSLKPMQLEPGPNDVQVASQSPEFVREILAAQQSPLLAAALQLTATYGWDDTRKAIEGILISTSDIRIQRFAAECLGRAGHIESLSALRKAWNMGHRTEASVDRVWEHAILFAMLEIAAKPSNREVAARELDNALSNIGNDPVNALAAIRVLKELKYLNSSSIEWLIKAAESDLATLSDLACDAIVADELLIEAYVAKLAGLTESELTSWKSLSKVTQRAYRSPTIVKWIENFLQSTHPWGTIKTELIEQVVAAYKGQTLPLSWEQALAKQLESNLPATDSLLQRIGATNIQKEATHLIQAIAAKVSSTEFSRSAQAIAAIPRGLVEVTAERQWQIVHEFLEPNSQHFDLAKQSLKRLNLDAKAWEYLRKNISQLGTVHVAAALEALASSTNARSEENDKRLIETIESLTSARSLSQDQIESWFKDRSQETKSMLKSKLGKMFAPPADMASRIEEIVKSLEAGDAYRGQDVFRSAKASCNACHRIGYVGGTIGPELTKIGQSRNRLDMVEAIAFPSHRIAQGFTSESILTEDDEVYSGLVALEDANRIELILSAEKRISIDKKAIAKRTTSLVSIMPAGMDRVLTTQELSDLIAFLEQSK